MFLLLFGEIVLFSASGVLGLQRHQSEFYFVTRQLGAAGVGLILMFVLSRIPYGFYRKLAFPIFLFEIGLVALTYHGKFGHGAGGARRWLVLGPVIIQPSEIAKIAVVILLAHLIAKYEEQKFSLKRWFFYFSPIVLLLGLIFKQPDLGTTTLITVTMIGMFFISGIRISYVLSVLGIASATFVFAMLHSDYRRRRLFAFLNPWADPQGKGFQTIQSFLSFHNGKVFGAGLGNGTSKLFFLPEVHTDFIFALVGEELGFIGTIGLLLVFVYLSYLLLKCTFRARDSFGTYLAFGLALSLVLQILVNLGGVTGMLPVKGLPLPFISWGRSALIVDLSIIGVLISVLRAEPSSEQKSET